MTLDDCRKAIDPPKIEAMDAAWKTLMDLGAVDGEAMTSRLTAMGRHVS
jgi:ATP-dependent RNA helicase DHX57